MSGRLVRTGDYRCGAETLTTGRPCNQKVYEPGERCGMHARCPSCGGRVRYGLGEPVKHAADCPTKWFTR